MNNDLLCHIEEPLIKEKDGNIIDVNDKFLNLTQFTKNELCGKHISEILDKLFRCNHKINITDIEIQTALFTKDLDVRFIKVKKYTSADNFNLYIFNEIENSRLDNKLLFVENLMNDNKIGIGIYTANDLKLIKANQKYLDYMPKPYNSKEVVYGKCLEEFMHNFKEYGAEKIIKNIIENNKPQYFTELKGRILGDNDYWDNTITPISENGQVKYIMSILENVTERVLSRNHIQRKNKLISSQKKELEVILDNMYDGLLVIDKHGNYIKKNKSICTMINKLTNITTLNTIGETIIKGKKYYDDNDKELELKDIPPYRVFKGETVKEQRMVLKEKQGKVYLDVNGVPIFDETGDFQYGILLYHNITHIIENNNKIKEQQQLIIKAEQEKLEVAEKALVMKDEFISLISHEFKTPLNVIYSAIQLIEYAYINETPDKVKTLIGNIKQNTFRQLRLVNNLLDVTRLHSGRFKLNIKNIDIVSLIKQISKSVKLYANQKSITLFFKCDLVYKNIAIDDEKLERIILNLLSNAIKFTNKEGTITVSLYENKETNMIVLEVSDTGIGIPKDKQELIFERFGQVDNNLSRHAEGTGIGLSLVKKLVDVLNGKIELKSEPGKGSTFKITLPEVQHIEEDKNESLFNVGNRLVNSLNVEFSDIYI